MCSSSGPSRTTGICPDTSHLSICSCASITQRIPDPQPMRSVGGRRTKRIVMSSINASDHKDASTKTWAGLWGVTLIASVGISFVIPSFAGLWGVTLFVSVGISFVIPSFAGLWGVTLFVSVGIYFVVPYFPDIY